MSRRRGCSVPLELARNPLLNYSHLYDLFLSCIHSEELPKMRRDWCNSKRSIEHVFQQFQFRDMFISISGMRRERCPWWWQQPYHYSLPVWVQWVLMQKLIFLDRMPPVNSWWPTIVQESALWKNAKATIARLNCLHWYVLWNSNVKISILHLVKYINSSNTVKPVLSGHRIKRTPSIKRTVAEVPKFIPLIFFKWHLY